MVHPDLSALRVRTANAAYQGGTVTPDQLDPPDHQDHEDLRATTAQLDLQDPLDLQGDREPLGMHQSGQDRLIITNNKKVPTLTIMTIQTQ